MAIGKLVNSVVSNDPDDETEFADELGLIVEIELVGTSQRTSVSAADIVPLRNSTS